MGRFFQRWVVEVGWALNGVCAFSVLVIISHDFVFAGWSPLFSGADKIWSLLYQLSLALVASYIFYYLNVHIPRQRDRANVLPFLQSRAQYVVNQANQVIDTLKSQSRHDFEGHYPSLADTKKLCAGVKTPTKLVVATLANGAQITMTEYLEKAKSQTEHFISEIYTAIPLVDTDLLQRVMAVDDCKYFRLLGQDVFTALSHRVTLTDLDFVTGELHDYFQTVSRLDQYIESYLK